MEIIRDGGKNVPAEVGNGISPSERGAVALGEDLGAGIRAEEDDGGGEDVHDVNGNVVKECVWSLYCT